MKCTNVAGAAKCYEPDFFWHSLTLALGMNMFSVSMCLTRVSVMSLTLGVYAISFMSRLSAIPMAARLEEEEPATATA